MNTSIIISLVSGIIACGALWVSYRSYRLTKQGRINDRLLELRLNHVELKGLIAEAQHNYDLVVVSSSKASNAQIKEHMKILFDAAEMLDKKLHGDLSFFNEKDIADATVVILEVNCIVNPINESIKKQLATERLAKR